MSAYVCGLDLSLTSTGIAFLNYTEAIKPNAKLRGLDRIRWIEVEICLSLENVVPDEPSDFTVAIEGPSYGSVGPGQHERGGLWWHMVNHLDNLGCRIVVVPPATLKKYATGKGNAGKDEVLMATARRFDWFKGGNDEADALWLAAVAGELAGSPLVRMPAVNVKDLASKVQWVRDPPKRPFYTDQVSA